MNWIRGEGTTKVQRWGLEGLGDINAYAADFGIYNDPNQTVISYPNIPADSPDYWQLMTGGNPNASATSMLDASGNNLVNVSDRGTTIGSWIQNNLLLIGVGLGAVLLLRRR